MGDTIASISRLIFLIEYAIRTHMLCINILQQRISKILTIMKRLQDFPAVIGHTGKVDPNRGKSFLPFCQLDQLALTEGSPVCRAVQKQQ